MRSRRFLSACLAFGLALGLNAEVFAQRVIHMVVPYGAGAVQDTVARAFSTELGQALGASIVVESRAGAGGTIGTAYVAKAAADGNTLLLAAASHTLAGHMYSKLPYHPIKDFLGVSLLGYSGYVIAAPAGLGVNSLGEYIRLVKSKPGQFNYASAGSGSATHLAMATLLAKTGLQMQHIPMKSTGDAVNEVLAGRVQGVASATTGVVGYRNDPRIKLLAYTGAQRSKFLPDLPTVAEAGLPGFRFDAWICVLAPAGVPKAEVERINRAVQKALAEPAVQDRFTRLGIENTTASPDEFQSILRADWDSAEQIVKLSGARVE